MQYCEYKFTAISPKERARNNVQYCERDVVTRVLSIKKIITVHARPQTSKDIVVNPDNKTRYIGIRSACVGARDDFAVAVVVVLVVCCVCLVFFGAFCWIFFVFDVIDDVAVFVGWVVDSDIVVSGCGVGELLFL